MKKPYRRWKGPPTKWTPERWAEVTQRVLQGESGVEIARSYGISFTTFYNVARAHGFKIKQVKRKREALVLTPEQQELIAQYFPWACGLARKHFSTAYRFDEALSAGVWGLVCAAQRYNIRKGGNFRTFAHKWVMGKMKDVFLTHERFKPLPSVLLGDLRAPFEGEGIDAQEVCEEHYERDYVVWLDLMRSVRQLPQKLYEVFWRMGVEGQKAWEVAGEWKIKESTVRRLYQEACVFLRQLLGEDYLYVH